MKPKEIFDKQNWIADMKKHKKLTGETIEAFHYIGDVIEDALSVLCKHIDELENLKRLTSKHKHLDGKVVMEV